MRLIVNLLAEIKCDLRESCETRSGNGRFAEARSTPFTGSIPSSVAGCVRSFHNSVREQQQKVARPALRCLATKSSARAECPSEDPSEAYSQISPVPPLQMQQRGVSGEGKRQMRRCCECRNPAVTNMLLVFNGYSVW